MKPSRIALFAAGMALGLAASTAAEARNYRLTVAAGQPTRALANLGLVEKFFVPEIEKRIKAAGLKDSVQFRQAYAGTLLKPRAVLLGVQDGIADIGYEPTLFHPDKLPLEQVSFAVPFCTDDVLKVSKAIDHLHATIPEMRAQYDKFKVERLSGGSFDTYQFFTSFKAEKLEDLKGHKLGSTGAILQWLRLPGVTSVDSNMMEYYNSTKTGVYDGFIIFYSAAPAMKYPEAAPFVQDVNFGAMYAAALIANKSSMSRLPKEIQKIIRDVAKEWGPAGDKAYADAGASGLAKSKQMFKNATFIKWSDAERKKWAMAMPNIAKEWAERTDKAGQPGTKVLKAYMDSLRRQGVNCLRQWDKE
ncbi:MAG: TRAP transporter substrate-binding protein DctP [Beijerinckiaceae bacterium]